MAQEQLKPLNLKHLAPSSIGISDYFGRKFEFCKITGSENMTQNVRKHLAGAQPGKIQIGHCILKQLSRIKNVMQVTTLMS